jgi:hypothetical protein
MTRPPGSRAADQPWHGFGDRIEHLAGSVAGGGAFLLRREIRQFTIPLLRKFALQERFHFARRLRIEVFVGGKSFAPVVA